MPAPARTDWREEIAPDEAERFERHAQTLHWLQEAHDALTGEQGRALHRKGHVGVYAHFEVLGELPEEARAGLFATPGRYNAYVRYSNGSPGRHHDARPDVRGLAIKLVGVPGKKLIPGLENETTQDFLAIQNPVTPFRNADEFVATVFAARRPALALPRLVAALGPWRAFQIIRRFAAGTGAKLQTVALHPYYSALPIRYGAYAAKYAFLPEPEPAPAPVPAAEAAHTRDHLGRELALRVAHTRTIYDVAVQLYRDPRSTPIEDASVEWRERDAPFIRVARLTIPVQDTESPQGRKLSAFIEKLSFDPWHALVEHRPLGDMMRARNHAYRVSTQARHAAAEPDGSESFS